MQDFGEGLTTLEQEECAPVDMFTALFEARGWDYERDGDDEVAAQYKGSWTSYQLRAVWRAQDAALQLLTLPDVTVPPEKFEALYTALGMINEQVWMGHFDLWSNNGMIVFRQASLMPQNGMIGIEQAQTMVDVAIDECERFYPVFQFIIWGDKSPKDALAAALVETHGEA